MSPEYKGRTIYHIVDSDEFNTEPDWDSEYVEEHFVDAKIDLYYMMKFASAVAASPSETQASVGAKKFFIKYLYGIGFLPDKEGTPFVNVKNMTLNASIKKVDGINTIDLDAKITSPYDCMIEGMMTKEQIVNLRSYYDDELRFIELQPPN